MVSLIQRLPWYGEPNREVSLKKTKQSYCHFCGNVRQVMLGNRTCSFSAMAAVTMVTKRVSPPSGGKTLCNSLRICSYRT